MSSAAAGKKDEMFEKENVSGKEASSWGCSRSCERDKVSAGPAGGNHL